MVATSPPSLDTVFFKLVPVATDLAEMAKDWNDRQLTRLALEVRDALSELHRVRELLADIAGVP